MSELKDSLPGEQREQKEGLEIHNLKTMTCQKDEHSFRYVKSQQVECVKCRTGFYLPPGGELKENHIYIEGKQVI